MKAAGTAFLLIYLATAGFADAVRCGICDQVIEGKYFKVQDKVRLEKVNVCPDCEKLETRCFACSLPIKTGATTLTDGRLLCAQDSKDAVMDESEAKAICLATREELDRSYSRFLSFPSTNVVLTIVDRFTLDSLFKAPGYERRCTAIFGATRTGELGDHHMVHMISVLSGLSKPRLQAVVAHEFTHTWLNENLSPTRRAVMAPDAVEGFCEYIAYQLMDDHHEEVEKKAIHENPYTRGQVDAYLEAGARHGFNTVMEWVKAGETAKLDPNDPDNVRQVKDSVLTPQPSRSPRPVSRVAKRPPPPLPEKLVLTSITGAPGRRFAIINDRTFAVADVIKLQLATTNLLVRCLEIRTNSVLVRMEDTGEKQELTFPAPLDPPNTGPYSLKIHVGPWPIERTNPPASPRPE